MPVLVQRQAHPCTSPCPAVGLLPVWRRRHCLAALLAAAAHRRRQRRRWRRQGFQHPVAVQQQRRHPCCPSLCQRRVARRRQPAPAAAAGAVECRWAAAAVAGTAFCMPAGPARAWPRAPHFAHLVHLLTHCCAPLRRATAVQAAGRLCQGCTHLMPCCVHMSWVPPFTAAQGAIRCSAPSRAPLAPALPAPTPARPPAGSIVSEAETEWSDGVAVAYRAQQLRQGVGFAALIRQPEVWAICGAQYTGG